MSQLDGLISELDKLSPGILAEIDSVLREGTGHMAIVPTAGPQFEAYYHPADEVFMGGSAGGGKLLCLSTPIPTPFGWTTMGEIRVGDQVFDERGIACSVVAKSAVETEGTYRLTFSDGATVVAGARHQWVTSTLHERHRARICTPEWRARRRAKRPQRGTGQRPYMAARNAALAKPLDLPTSGVRTTEEIARSLVVRGRTNHSIKVSGTLRLPDVELPVDPYVLGAWLGDGTSAGASITIAEPEMAEAVGGALPHHWTIRKRASTYAYGIVGGLQTVLRSLGVLGNKHIPAVYLRAGSGQRLALLQGLMDTDGYCDDRGQCEFTSTRKQLADDVLELILSLGIKAAISEGIASIGGRRVGPKYRIKFLADLPAFRLSRKLIRQKRAGFRGTHALRYIVGAEKIDPVPMQCIQVDSPSSMYLCGRAMIPTHNSALAIGLALNEHHKSAILRRYVNDAKKFAEQALEIIGHRDGYNGQDRLLRLPGGRSIRWEGCNEEKDKQRFKGDPYDLYVFDEIPDFLESQYLFITGWNRTTRSGQRCRVVCTGNPPTTPEGLWVIRRWAAWLDPKHPNPAKSGETRWFIRDHEDRDIEVEGAGEFDDGSGRFVKARSRTFIRARLEDNPDLTATDDYERSLDALPKELRDAYRDGKFDASLRDTPNQVVPTEWVKEAQARWTPNPPVGVPQCAIGVDGAREHDKSVLAARYDGWYAPLVAVPGKETPSGLELAALIVKHRRDKSVPIIDVIESVGAQAYAHLREDMECKPFRGNDSTSKRTQERQLGFYNRRAEVYWRFREALDPSQDGGSPIMLPEDPELVSDLTAPTWELSPRGIKIEAKEDLVKRLGRSPDKGDAVVMAWSDGAKMPSHYHEWRGGMYGTGRGGTPGVNLGKRRRKH